MNAGDYIGILAGIAMLILALRIKWKDKRYSTTRSETPNSSSDGITRIYLIAAERPANYNKPNYIIDPSHYNISPDLQFSHPTKSITNYVYLNRQDAIDSTKDVNFLTLGIAVLDFRDGHWNKNAEETDALIDEFT